VAGSLISLEIFKKENGHDFSSNSCFAITITLCRAAPVDHLFQRADSPLLVVLPDFNYWLLVAAAAL